MNPGPERGIVRPAVDGDAEAVLELATMMAISFTVAPDAFHRSFATILGAPDAHLLVIDVDGQVGGYLLGSSIRRSSRTARWPGSRRSRYAKGSDVATSVRS